MFTPKQNRTRYNPLDTSSASNTSFTRTAGRQNVSQIRQRAAKTGFGAIELSRQSDIDQAQHQVNELGASLPIVVRETLALKKDVSEDSCYCDASGYARLISGQRLFIWNYSPSAAHTAALQCYELSLPFTTTQLTASLVAVLPPAGHSSPGCVAVTPEGELRYWPDVVQQSLFSDINVDTRDDQCASLITLQDGCCVLATANSQLYLIMPNFSQRSVRCRELRGGAGMLSGLGRRVTSLFWGGGGGDQHSDTPLHRLLAGETLPGQTQAVYVLCGMALQKWLIHNEQEKLLYQCDVGSLFRTYAAQEIWGENEQQLSNLQTWLLDIQVNRDGILLLGAALNTDVSMALHFALGSLHTEGEAPPRSFLSFSVPQFTQPYQQEQAPHILGYHLLMPNTHHDTAFLYNANTVICTSVGRSSDAVDELPFSSGGDQLIGAGVFDQHAVFLSAQHGLVTVILRQTQASFSESFLDTSTRVDTCLTSGPQSDQLAEMSMSEDKLSRLKAAFLLHCRGSQFESERIVDELFPSGVPATTNSPLDTLVLQLSLNMIDDFPASDPRWAESIPTDAGSSSSSLILIHQLEDKLKAHDVLISFLRSVQLWPRLTSVSVRGGRMDTSLMLCENAEKLVAAQALRQHHTQYSHLVDVCIGGVMEQRDVPPSDRLTPQDHFYRQVSGVGDIVAALVSYEDQEEELAPPELVTLVSAVNNIICGMVYAAAGYRQSNTGTFHSDSSGTEYLPWTCTSGTGGIRTLLTQQHTITVERAIPEAANSQQRDELFQQLLQLTDAVLDGYRAQLDSIKSSVGGESLRYNEVLRHYEAARHKLITPFVEEHQHDRAASLAEKFCDFRTLVELCETSGNQDRLQHYINHFANQGFSDFLFRWYVEKGKRADLLKMEQLASHPKLSGFLASDENRFMSWIHDIGAADYLKAHSTLLDLAREEKHNFNKKKTLLSLSKLAAWASKDPPDLIHHNWQEILQEQNVMLHQEQLPQSVLDALGMNSEQMNVLSPHDIIKLYVDDDINPDSNEYDFKKALDVLSLIMDKTTIEEREAILLDIWSHAILRDRWENLATDAPECSTKGTIFMRTVEMAFYEGMDLGVYLPTKDKLLSANALQHLRTSDNFGFLLGAAYEHIMRFMVRA